MGTRNQSDCCGVCSACYNALLLGGFKQLELHAAKVRWNTLRLQTSRNMLAANRFYERHGYELIPNYGEYVGSASTVSYEKVIV